MTAIEVQGNPQTSRPRRSMGLFNNIKSSQKSGLLAAFNEVGNTVLIVFVSFFGSRVHRPRCIGIGAMIASVGVFLIALPHFISEKYIYTDFNSNTKDNSSGLCQSLNPEEESNQTCDQEKNDSHLGVYPILLLGQLLLGIGGVPIQPFGISYIDDYAEKRNSPFYLGILFAITVIGPAFGYMMSSVLLRFYVDVDKMYSKYIDLNNDDPRWVGAWWLGFLIAATLLLLTSLPYLFFPRKMSREEIIEAPVEPSTEKMMEDKKPKTDMMEEVSLTEFLKSFPKIVMRTLRNPIYLLVVLAQVNLAAMVAGLATFMGKFIERQFAQTVSFSNLMMGGLNIPSAMLGIMAGGVILRKLGLTVRSSAAMCTVAVFVSIMFAIPLLFIGCPTQKVSGINYNISSHQCSNACSCSDEAFNPVCGSDGVEFRSPCHAGCKTKIPNKDKVLNYTDCECVASIGSPGFALPGPCGNGCNNRLIPFMILSSFTCFVASLSHTTSFMMILRTVTPEDKSFALGIQFMLFRVLAFLPAPVLYGRAIDTACILWGKKCSKITSCRYYDLDLFRHRFLGLQIFFIFGGFVCFFLSFMVLRRTNSTQEQNEKINNQTKSENSQEMKDAKQMISNSNGHCNTQRILRE
ncbi:solute carrier organic anion transporter family member 2B1-like [Sinocyclocheilus anshuiensis]|uniref:solute carrier organic anion transporter family member 2B1-like n=1 Tax=Sinocyclocheilus anshuiensis TaxID=1608454 RepID=UPI0007B864E8|nr:PREDICTED: solute carrier organic anion transporter family member 2B1-like [Sinocyclocheilus anshuiensis]